jgi:hypothetical protein
MRRPLYPRKQTLSGDSWMSALGQRQTLPSTFKVPLGGLLARASVLLRAGTRDEAANSCRAVAVLIGPHNGRTETVGFGHNCRVRHHKPLSLNADTIMVLLGIPVDVLHTDTVSKSAAQSVSTPKVFEPFLKRRIGEAAIVTRV